MGVSRCGSRLSMLFLGLLIALMIAGSAAAQTAPANGDVYSSQGGGAPNNSNGFGNQIRGIIISMTPVGINRVDVKLQDPVTGYIHSVTVEADVVQGLKVGQRVTQYSDPETGEQMIAPTLIPNPGQSVPGQTQETGTGQPPPDNGAPPPNTVPGIPPLTPLGPPGNGVPANPVPGNPPKVGGVGDNGPGGVPPTIPPPSLPYYPEPKMVGNYVGSGSVEGTPVDIGGPNAVPIPAGARPGTPVTVNSKTGDGPWKRFRGTLQSGPSGYYVQFNQGYYQGYYNGQYVNRWVPIQPPQSVAVHAG